MKVHANIDHRDGTVQIESTKHTDLQEAGRLFHHAATGDEDEVLLINGTPVRIGDIYRFDLTWEAR